MYKNKSFADQLHTPNGVYLHNLWKLPKMIIIVRFLFSFVKIDDFSIKQNTALEVYYSLFTSQGSNFQTKK